MHLVSLPRCKAVYWAGGHLQSSAGSFADRVRKQTMIENCPFSLAKKDYFVELISNLQHFKFGLETKTNYSHMYKYHTGEAS